jgi:hypothetical protein
MRSNQQLMLPASAPKQLNAFNVIRSVQEFIAFLTLIRTVFRTERRINKSSFRRVQNAFTQYVRRMHLLHPNQRMNESSFVLIILQIRRYSSRPIDHCPILNPAKASMKNHWITYASCHIIEPGYHSYSIILNLRITHAVFIAFFQYNGGSSSLNTLRIPICMKDS